MTVLTKKLNCQYNDKASGHRIKVLSRICLKRLRKIMKTSVRITGLQVKYMITIFSDVFDPSTGKNKYSKPTFVIFSSTEVSQAKA
jgi:hypothetical protein